MLRLFTTLAALLALAVGAPGHAAGCRGPRCAAHSSAHPAPRHAVSGRGYGRVVSPVPSIARQDRRRPLSRPDFTQRPVLPGQQPLPAYLPNNAPPVFAPQPLP